MLGKTTTTTTWGQNERDNSTSNVVVFAILKIEELVPNVAIFQELHESKCYTWIVSARFQDTVTRLQWNGSKPPFLFKNTG